MTRIAGYASSLSNQIKWHGDHNDNDSQIILKAGCLAMLYENGNLRHVSNGKTELLRMIYSAVRDKDWLTLKPIITEEIIDIRNDSFSIQYKCHYHSEKIDFSAEYFIEGRSDNSISFIFRGKAVESLIKNRIGFCVLHPIRKLAGTECTIVHSNNESENLNFPLEISPHQPFTDIVSMRWVSEGNALKLDFYGDIFETEDQRNWTDASYKTYCTPLSLRFPAEVEKGTTISQRIEFKAAVEVEGQAKAKIKAEKKYNSPILITVYPGKRTRIPVMGIGSSSRPEPITGSEINIFRDLRFDHYRVDLFLFFPDWKVKAETAFAESIKLAYQLEFALFFDDDFDYQVTQFIFWIKDKKTDTGLFILYHRSSKTTPDSIISKVVPLLRNAIPGVKVACGTNSNFAQLNRNRPESDLFDLFTYSIHPQEHASDNITLVENLQGQGYTVESAKHFSNSKGIWISPVTIQRRFNANKENYEQTFNYSGLPSQVDSRLMSLLGASWTAASIKYLSEAGVEGVTYFETVGERGIIQGDFPSRWPEDFKSVKGMIFPLFHVFRFILDNKAFVVNASLSSDPLTVDILTLSHGIELKMILMNFTGVIQTVRLKDIYGEFRMKQLNAGNFSEAASDMKWYQKQSATQIDPVKKLLLEPFSISFIEGKVRN
jgi:hypothetical protein